MSKRFVRAASALAFVLSSASFALVGTASAQVCAYNSTQGTCACPTSGGGTTCFGGQEYRSTDSTCVADTRPCASNQKYDCSAAACACDTSNYPCGGCTVATSVVGASCGGGAGTYANQCGSCTINPYVLVSPTAQQPGYIDVAGDIKGGGDHYFINGKAVRVDGAGSTVLNVGNWGSGATGFTEKVFGTLDATQVCISGVCMSTWPGGTGRGGAVPMYGGPNGTTGQSTFTDSWIRQSALGNLTLGVDPAVNGGASSNGGATVAFGGSLLGMVGGDAIAFTPPTWNSVDVGVMFWDKPSGAFRSGYAGTSNNWQLSKLGKGSVAFGHGPEASGDYSFAFGGGYSRADSSFVVNAGAVTGVSGIAMGNGATVSAQNGVAIAGGSVSGVNGVAIGATSSAQAAGTSGIAIGAGAASAGNQAIAIGRGTASGAGSMVIGSQGAAGLTNATANSVMFGGNSNVPAMFIAPSSNVAIPNNIAIGTNVAPSRLYITQVNGTEGLRVISSNFSPLVIRNTLDTADLMRLDQVGNLTIAGTFSAAGLMGGSGTASYVPKFTATNTLGNSGIFDSGTAIGIGTATPTAQLTIKGGTNVEGLKIVSPTTASPLAVRNSADSADLLRVGQGGNLTIPGQLAIGGATPSAQLDVAGRIHVVPISAGTTAYVEVDRPLTSHYAEMDFSTAGVMQWGLGLQNDGTNDLSVRNNVGTKMFTMQSGTGNISTIGATLTGTAGTGLQILTTGGQINIDPKDGSDIWEVLNNGGSWNVALQRTLTTSTGVNDALIQRSYNAGPYVLQGDILAIRDQSTGTNTINPTYFRLDADTQSGTALFTGLFTEFTRRDTINGPKTPKFSVDYAGNVMAKGLTINSPGGTAITASGSNFTIDASTTGTVAVSGTGNGANSAGVWGANGVANNTGSGVLGFNFGGGANSYGVQGNHSNTGANAGFFQNSGGGRYAYLAGYYSGMKVGGAFTVNSATDIAGYFENNGNGNSVKLGGDFAVSATAAGTTAATTAAQFNAYSSGPSTVFGVRSYANNLTIANTTNYGYYTLTQGGTGSGNTGVEANVTGSTSSINFGAYYNVSGSNANQTTGVYAKATGTSTGFNIGGRFTASGSAANNIGVLVSAGGGPGSTTNYAAQFSGGDVQIATGNLQFATNDLGIDFSNTAGAGAMSPEIYMFGLTSGGNRMILAESKTYSTWGIAYDYPSDTMQWKAGGTVKASISAGSGTITTTSDLVAESNSWGTGSGWILCSQNTSCQCPNGSYMYAIYNYFLSYGYGYIACAKL